MRLSFGALLFLLAALPVQAQRASLADRVSALESQAATQTQGAGQANMELLNRTTQMQDEIRALRAIIEQLQNDLEQARQRNREQYIGQAGSSLASTGQSDDTGQVRAGCGRRERRLSDRLQQPD